MLYIVIKYNIISVFLLLTKTKMDFFVNIILILSIKLNIEQFDVLYIKLITSNY